MKSRQRILSVDVLRGLTVAGMIVVNNPGSWGSVYAPLRHAQWLGLTPTDLVFPFFIFIMGVSAWFSLGRRSLENPRNTVFHIFRRSVLIFAVGAILNALSRLAGGSLSWDNFRILGVLQAISLTYLFGSLLLMALKFRHLLMSAALLLGGWWIVQLLGSGFDLSPDNIIAVVDRAVLGEGHMYTQSLPDGGGRIPFDPESLLTTIPRTAQFLLGAFMGKLLLSEADRTEKLNRMFIFGSVILVVGLLVQYGCPLSKKVWTSSFALATSGFASLLLALFYWLIDIRGKKSWTGFFRVFGVNPLPLYVLSSIFASLLGMRFMVSGTETSVKSFLYNDVLSPFLGDYLGSLAYALLLVAIIWLVGYILDRKKIYIRL